jgi:hypothetical protein
MPVASRMKSSEKMPKASGKTGATSNVPGALVSLNLSHRLFATFESDKQGRKRSKKVHVLPPSPSTDEPESTECSDDEPIYRGSVAHLVLQKIDEIDQTFLRDEPDDFAMAKEGIDEAHQGQKKSLLKTNMVTPVKCVPRLSVPRIDRVKRPLGATGSEQNTIIRPEIVPQPRSFREGDRVAVRRAGKDQRQVVGKYAIIWNCTSLWRYGTLPQPLFRFHRRKTSWGVHVHGSVRGKLRHLVFARFGDGPHQKAKVQSCAIRRRLFV